MRVYSGPDAVLGAGTQRYRYQSPWFQGITFSSKQTKICDTNHCYEENKTESCRSDWNITEELVYVCFILDKQIRTIYLSNYWVGDGVHLTKVGKKCFSFSFHFIHYLCLLSQINKGPGCNNSSPLKSRIWLWARKEGWGRSGKCGDFSCSGNFHSCYKLIFYLYYIHFKVIKRKSIAQVHMIASIKSIT